MKHPALRLSIRPRRAIAPLASLALTVLLTGCSLWEKEEAPPPCPHASVLADASRVTKFRDGPGRDLTDILYGAEITQIRSQCEYDLDDTTKRGTVTVHLAMQIEVSRGPADRDRQGTFEYFVSVTDLNRRVLNKRTFPLVVPFEGNRSRLIVPEGPVTLTIPLNAEQTGRDFDILVGFQLTRSELRYNQRGRGGLR